MEIEKDINVCIVNNINFTHDFLIGLDCIKKFKLTQNDKLEIKQNNMDYKYEQERSIIPTTKGKTENIDNLYKNEVKKPDLKLNFNEDIEINNFEATTNDLGEKERIKIENLINKYSMIFAKNKYDVGSVKDYEARIDLQIDKYCSKRPYRCTIDDKKEIEQQIAKLLERKLIEESYSPFAAPVTLAFKKDEGSRSRLCIDFRDLNKIIVPEPQPFPRIDDILVKTRNCKSFTKLDINSAFWSIPLRIEDRKKTGFVTQEGHYQWTCLPFGLKTSPAIFQRILSNIIRKHGLSNFTINYIDDILIFSKTFEEHIIHLENLLQAVKKEGFRLKLTKCEFAMDSVTYLGHVISYNSVTPMKDNLIAIKNFPTPNNQKNIRQFLGKVNFYNEYIPKNAIILEPLHKLLRKNQKFEWTEDCQRTFDYLKNFLCTQPILSIYDAELPVHIYTDGSLLGLGAILKQPQPDENGKEKPVAYFSRKLNDAQKKKKAIYLETLAIKEAVLYWQHWLMGRSFKIFTDHKPLSNLNIKARPDEELGDLTLYLTQFDMTVEYNPGKFNLEADCLSRNPVLKPEENREKMLRTVNIIKLQDIIEDQKNNDNIDKENKKLIQKKGVFFKKIKYNEKIILTEEFSKNLIKKVHISMGHIGINQMVSMLSPNYTSKNFLNNVTDVCNSCGVCIKNKTRKTSNYGLLSQLGPAYKPFEIVSIDTIGGFGGTRSTKKYLHLLVDHFSRYAFILTSKTQTGADFTKLTNEVLNQGKIEKILTDQYPGINSKEFKKFLETKDIPLIFTAVNAPFSNGLNERLNQTLINKIRCKLNEQEKKVAWTTIAHKCVDEYNKTIHTVTKFSPEYLLKGAENSMIPEELKSNKIQDLEKDRLNAAENSIKYHNYNKKIFDKHRKDYVFEAGDQVYIENGNRLNRKKLEEIRIGPYRIEEKVSNSIYKINTGHKKKESNLFHITKFIPIPKQLSDKDK